MESKAIEDYIWFGTALRYLQDAAEGFFVFPQGGVLYNIEEFARRVDELGLTVTSRTQAMWDLEQLRQELLADDDDDERLLSDNEASRLRSIMTDVRKTLLPEARGREAFIVSEKRLDVVKLLSNVRALVTPEAYDKMPPIAQQDLDESGKCIAFLRPTAGAFHLLRGTEDVLRAFYCAKVKQKRVNPLMWDPMVKSLKARRTPPAKELLDGLDSIRGNYRNPTQHPDKIYDIDEVQDLFGVCVDVIRRMARDL